jgi:hypothetical protein
MKTKPNPFQKAVRSFLRDVIEASKPTKTKKSSKKASKKSATPKAEKPTGKPAGYVAPKVQRNFEKFMAEKAGK